MFADLGRGAVDAARPVGQLEPRTDQAQRAMGRVHFLQQVARRDLGVFGDFVDALDRGAGHVGGGQVFDGIVTNVDFAQTFLDAAGVDPHDRMQGRSFWADLVGDPATPPAEGMYYRYWEHDDVFHHAPAHYGYRTRTHKIIYYYNDGLGLPGTGPFTYPGEWELYDLAADPAEMRNVYDDPDYREIREELKRAMWLEQARLGDEPHRSQPVPDLEVSDR